MKYLLFFLVIGLLVSPVLAALPGPHQRRREKLRQSFVGSGITLCCGVHQTLSGEHLPSGDMTRYSIAVPISHRTPLSITRTDVGEAWRLPASETGESAARLQAIVKDFPDTVQTLEISGHNVAAYWREEGDETDAQQLRYSLHRLAEQFSRTDI